MKANPPCILCGGKTVIRRSQTGLRFVCERHPKCQGQVNYFPYEPGDEFDDYFWDCSPWAQAVEWYDHRGIPVYDITTHPKPGIEKVKAKLAAAMGTESMPEATGLVPAWMPKPDPNFIPSVYQQAIIDWVIKTNVPSKHIRALVVKALAGTGKTTTAVQIIKYMPPTQSVIFVAFNADIRDAMRLKAPKSADVASCHQIGLWACKKAWPDLKIDKEGAKMRSIMESVLDKQTYRHLYPAIRQLAEMVKNTLRSTQPADLEYLVSRYGIEIQPGDKASVYTKISRHL